MKKVDEKTETMPQQAITSHHLEMFMKMMVTYKIDELKFGPIELRKSQHDIDFGKPETKAKDNGQPTEDELYYSSRS